MKILEYLFPYFYKNEESLIDFDSIDTFSSYTNSSLSVDENEFVCCFFKCFK